MPRLSPPLPPIYLVQLALSSTFHCKVETPAWICLVVYTNNSQLGTHPPAHHHYSRLFFHSLTCGPFCNPFVFKFMHRMRVYSPCASFLCVPLRTLRLCVILFPSSVSAILFAVGSLPSAPHPEIRGAPCRRCA